MFESFKILKSLLSFKAKAEAAIALEVAEALSKAAEN